MSLAQTENKSMHKFILFTLLSLMTNVSVAIAADNDLPPLDESYMGTHGMVLMSYNSNVFASHLPLYHKPHDVQLLYKLEVKDLALMQLVRDAELVTIKPEPFNLQRLMRGEKMTINADVYMGHFERDGMEVYNNIALTFDKLLYVRSLADIEESSTKQVYDAVSYRKNNKIYVHRIQKAPSFDHLIHIDENASCSGKFNTSSAVPEESELQYKFLNCGTMKPLYFEKQDFSKY